jgi:hypothetical protein
MRDTTLQVLLAVLQLWVLVLAIPAFLLLPGILFAAMYFIGTFLNTALLWLLKGNRVCPSSQQEFPNSDEFSDERWIFINGSMTRYARSPLLDLINGPDVSCS